MSRKKSRKRAKAVPVPRAHKCCLCGFVTESAGGFQDHLFSAHNELTLRGYRRLYPGQKPFDLSRHLITAEQLYQAVLYRAVHGAWPDWYDGRQLVDITDADPTLLKVFATLLVRHYMHKLGPMMLYTSLATERLFNVGKLPRAGAKTLLKKLGYANEEIRKIARSFGDLGALLAKADRKANLPMHGRFVAAGEIGNDREAGALQHEATAQLSEISDLVQGFLREGPENLPVPPSQHEEKEERD